ADAQAYRIGPSDELEITVDNFSQTGRADSFRRSVDQRGYISFPRTKSIFVAGKTEAESREAIIQAIREAQLLANPIVDVQLTAQRQQTFNATGAVRNAGTYFIPKP